MYIRTHTIQRKPFSIALIEIECSLWYAILCGIWKNEKEFGKKILEAPLR